MNHFKSTLIILCLALTTQAFAQTYLGVRSPSGAYYGDTGLSTIDIQTGTVSSTVDVTGVTVEGYTGLAIDQGTGTLYAVVKNGSDFSLCTIDPATGAATLVGATQARIAGITITPDGTMYAITGDGGSPSSTLFEINTSDGTATELFTPGGVGGDGETIAFNSDDNLIYRYGGGGLFQSINPATQDVVDIATLSGIDIYAHSMYYDANTGNFIFSGGGSIYELDPSGNLTSLNSELYGAGWKGIVLEGDLFLNTSEVEVNRFDIVPNPATDFVQVQLDKTYTNVNATVFNALGQLVITQKFQGVSQVELNLENLASGNYWIKLDTDGTLSSQQVVVE